MKISKIIPLIFILTLLAGCQAETPLPSPTNAPPTAAPAQPTLVEVGIGEGSILLTGDGQEVTLITYLEIGENVRWAVGSQNDRPNLVLYSGDGGLSWADRTPLDSTLDPGTYAKAILSFCDDMVDEGNTGWVIFDGSNLLWKTTDAGLSWESYPLEISASRYSMIDILNPDTAWVMIITVYEPRDSFITLHRTLDGGNQWEVMLTPSDGGPHTFNQNGFSFGSAEYGWIARSQGFYDKPYLDITRDGGRTWEMVNYPPPPAFPDYFEDCQCDVFDPQVSGYGIGTFHLTCTCYGDSDYPYTDFEYMTNDDGGSWTITALPD